MIKMKKWIQRISILSITFLLLVSMVGCNTIAGAGEDIEETGEVIEESADNDQESFDYDVD
jgi:predicted small secreted protein